MVRHHRARRRNDPVTVPRGHYHASVTFLDALGRHPYARFTLGMMAAPDGLVRGDTVIWWGDTAFGRIAHACGPPVELSSLPSLEGVRWLNLPAAWPVPIPWLEHDRWDFRWTAAAPPAPRYELSTVDSPREVERLLDAAHPDTLRPGHPLVRQWWGIRAGGALVACAADRSAGDVGAIGALTVHPEHQRRGYGTAISAGLTRLLLNKYGLCCLGVMDGNTRAAEMYERLGYRDALPLRSVMADTG